MLHQHLGKISDKVIYLASSSPRREELLRLTGLNFLTRESKYAEDKVNSREYSPTAFVEYLAQNKAQALSNQLQGERIHVDLIIGADTIIYYDNKIIGKPKDPDDAIAILTSLSGASHFVYTGVSLVIPSGSYFKHERSCAFHEKTEVKMCKLDFETIKAYVSTGEPLDKAGSYGIQGFGSTLVEGIVGDYFNVVGLPISHLSKALCSIIE